MEPATLSWIPRLYVMNEELQHGKVAAGSRVGDDR